MDAIRLTLVEEGKKEVVKEMCLVHLFFQYRELLYLFKNRNVEKVQLVISPPPDDTKAEEGLESWINNTVVTVERIGERPCPEGKCFVHHLLVLEEALLEEMNIQADKN
jgi:hypothetical protein